MHNTDNGTDQGAGDQQTPSGRAAVSVQGTGPAAASSAVATAANTTAGVGGPRECAGCGKRITERYLLKALDMFWHEDCLKCGCCDCRLGEVGSTLYTKANLILCKRDYLRLFGTTGYCAACNKVIPAFEMVMRAKSNVYHLECFACQQCNHRFCVGDRFYLCDNKILCEYDYEERLVFANMAYNPSSLAHIRRQVSNLQSCSGIHWSSCPMRTGNFLKKDKAAKCVMLATSPASSAVALPAGDNLSINYENPRLLQPQQQPQQHHHHPHHHHHHHHHQVTSTPFFGNNKSPMLIAPVSGGSSGAGQQLRDDGSSGYGSPDSETFDAQCN